MQPILPNKLDLGKASKEILELSNYEILEEFIFLLESLGASPETIKAYRSAVKDFIDFIGDKHLKEVSLKDILVWRNTRLKKGFKRQRSMDKDSRLTTLHYYTLFLKRFFNWLGIDLRIPRVKKPPRKIDVLSEEDVVKLYNASRDPLDKIILKLLLDTGLRSRELLGLRVMDIDFNKKTIRVRETKYGRERYVIITADTAELLKAWIRLKGLRENDKIIPLTYNGLYKRLKTLARRAGLSLSKVRPHVLRHTFATNALKKGMNIYSLQRLLGHRDIKTTQLYLHLTVDDIRREYEKIMEKNTTYCINCGREIPVNSIYCPYCGYKLKRESSIEA